MVIVGAGFGGLTCARQLRKAPVGVLVLDANNYHLFTPFLYQVASSLLEPAEVANSVRSLLRPLHNADFLRARVTGADLDRKVLMTDHGDVAYDYLVLATGSESNYFGNQSIEEHSIGLKTLPEGMALRNLVLDRFEQARWVTDPEVRAALLTFTVVGGGPTGVEYAGALSELVRLALRRDYRGANVSEVRIVLIEGLDRLLAAFDPKLSAAALRSLRKKGVDVRLGTLVKEVDRGGIELSDGHHLATNTVVWTAGVRPTELARTIGIPVSHSGRAVVRPTLQVPGHDEVFVIGDASGPKQDGGELPMLIPVANQEAKHTAANIRALVEGRRPTDFRYHDPGIMATIGRNSAVAQLGPVKLSGFLGWGMWLTVHLLNVISFRSRLIVLVNWAWDYLFYDRPVRIIVRADQPRVPGSGPD